MGSQAAIRVWAERRAARMSPTAAPGQPRLFTRFCPPLYRQRRHLYHCQLGGVPRCAGDACPGTPCSRGPCGHCRCLHVSPVSKELQQHGAWASQGDSMETGLGLCWWPLRRPRGNEKMMVPPAEEDAVL